MRERDSSQSRRERHLFRTYGMSSLRVERVFSASGDEMLEKMMVQV